MRVEAAVGVDRLDAGPDVEPVVVLLDLLVGVERRAVPEGPLALAAVASGLAAGRGGRRLFRGSGHDSTSFGTGRRAALNCTLALRRGGAQVLQREEGAAVLGLSARRTDGAGHAAEVDVASTHQGNSSSRHDGSVSRASRGSPPLSTMWTRCPGR